MVKLKAADFYKSENYSTIIPHPNIIDNEDGTIDITCGSIYNQSEEGDSGDHGSDICTILKKDECLILYAERIQSRMGTIDWFNRESLAENKLGYIFYSTAPLDASGSLLSIGNKTLGFMFAKQVVVLTPSYASNTNTIKVVLQLGINEIPNPGIFGLSAYKVKKQDLINCIGILKRKEII